MKVKRFIDTFVPVYACNLKCKYCYISQYEENCNANKILDFKYTPEQVKRALSQERLGGICHFNLCGAGETLLPANLVDYVRVLLENGHSVMIVTNATLTKRFEDYLALPSELKSRLGFKCSLHYLELKRLNLLDTFFDNVKRIREGGCSFSVELTPNDEYEPYIEEIKKICLERVGALCHLSVPRDEPEKDIPLLSKHSLEEFYNIWKSFDSPMFENKIKYWGKKRSEYCHAGMYTGLLSLYDGCFTSCYKQKYRGQYIFDNIEKPIIFCPAGRCKLPHCFNGHSFLAFGNIPELDFCSYADIRDRVDQYGNHWLTEEMRNHLSCKLYDSNPVVKKKKDKVKYLIINNKLRVKYLAYKISGKFKKQNGKK